MIIDFQKFQKGLEYREARERHQASFLAFKWNGDDLIALIKKLETPNPQAPVQVVLDQHVDVLRHFQNFASSAMSLVDASRAWTQKMPSFEPEYKAKVNESFRREAHQLVQGLRVHFLHRGIPKSTTMHTTTVRIDFRSNAQEYSQKNSFILDIRALLTWEKWGDYSAAKVHLESLRDDHLDLMAVVQPYYDQAIPFYDWFYRRMDEQHRELIDELRRTPNPRLHGGWAI